MDSVHTRKTRQEEEGEGDTPSESTTIEYEAQGVMRMRGWEIVRNGAKAKADCETQKKWLAYRQTPKTNHGRNPWALFRTFMVRAVSSHSYQIQAFINVCTQYE